MKDWVTFLRERTYLGKKKGENELRKSELMTKKRSSEILADEETFFRGKSDGKV